MLVLGSLLGLFLVAGKTASLCPAVYTISAHRHMCACTDNLILFSSQARHLSYGCNLTKHTNHENINLLLVVYTNLVDTRLPGVHVAGDCELLGACVEGGAQVWQETH